MRIPKKLRQGRLCGYEVCDNLLASSSVKALSMALANRQYHEAIIHHSDRGLQYSSKVYTDLLKANGFQISMTQDGSPYANAVAGRINGILKGEFGLDQVFCWATECVALAVEGIALCNTLRPHLSCGLLTPEQMHQQRSQIVRTYKKARPTCENSLDALQTNL